MAVTALFQDFGIIISDLNFDERAASASAHHLYIANSIEARSDFKRKLVRIGRRADRAYLFCSGRLSHIRALTSVSSQIVSGQIAVPELVRQVSPDVIDVVSAACDYALHTGSAQLDVMAFSRSTSFTRHFESAGITSTIPYFGRVGMSGRDARALSQRLTAIGIGLERNGSTLDTRSRKSERVRTWLPTILMEHDHRVDSWETSICRGRYYEVYDVTDGYPVASDSVVTAFCTLTTTDVRPGAFIDRLFFHCYVDDRLVILMLNQASLLIPGHKTQFKFDDFSLIAADVPENISRMEPISKAAAFASFARAKTSRFTVSQEDGQQSERTSFYSSKSRLIHVDADEESVFLTLDQETLDLAVDQLRRRCADREDDEIDSLQGPNLSRNPFPRQPAKELF